MPLTCINHLCRFLRSPQHGAVSQPVGEARRHMFQLRWIKLEVGGDPAQSGAAACGLGASSPGSEDCCLLSCQRDAQGPVITFDLQISIPLSVACPSYDFECCLLMGVAKHLPCRMSSSGKSQACCLDWCILCIVSQWYSGNLVEKMLE